MANLVFASPNKKHQSEPNPGSVVGVWLFVFRSRRETQGTTVPSAEAHCPHGPIIFESFQFLEQASILCSVLEFWSNVLGIKFGSLWKGSERETHSCSRRSLSRIKGTGFCVAPSQAQFSRSEPDSFVISRQIKLSFIHNYKVMPCLNFLPFKQTQ